MHKVMQGVYHLLAFFIQNADNLTSHKMVDVEPNHFHIAWQIPQYVLLTAGEVMFSITGLEFSYSQVGQPSRLQLLSPFTFSC